MSSHYRAASIPGALRRFALGDTGGAAILWKAARRPPPPAPQHPPTQAAVLLTGEGRRPQPLPHLPLPYGIGAAGCRGTCCARNLIASAAAVRSPRDLEDQGGVSRPISTLIGTFPVCTVATVQQGPGAGIGASPRQRAKNTKSA